VILPVSCSLQRRQPRTDIAWMFPSILTSFSWFSWNAANGAPNCFLSCRYLTAIHAVHQRHKMSLYELLPASKL
jgi:hypothetical protein